MWIITVRLDSIYTIPAEGVIGLLFAGSADGARNLLATIAGSMITTAVVTFSITIAALVQASGQLGPRLLKNFMRDRGNQITLGTFVATFLYCLLVLRIIRSSSLEFVPHISLTVSLILAIASVIVLVYYIHHISTLIQAENAIARVGGDLNHQIDRLIINEKHRWSDREPKLREQTDFPEDFGEQNTEIKARKSGYVQAYATKDLIAYADKEDLILHLMVYPGRFVIEDSAILRVYPQHEATSSLEDTLENTLILGKTRLNIQDVLFYVDQLVEIAVRALSPGINDPFTAIACVDQLSATLAELAEEDIPSGYYYSHSKLRLIVDDVTFQDILNSAYDQIRHYGRGDVKVTLRLLETLALIALHTQDSERRQTIKQQGDKVLEGARKNLELEADLNEIEEQYIRLLKTLKANK